MEVDYFSNKLGKQLASPSEIKKAFGPMAQKVSLRLHQIKNSPTLAVLMSIPGTNCHPLKGAKTGEWAVDISGNYRMVFRLNHEPVPKREDNSINANLVTKILILSIEDYH